MTNVSKPNEIWKSIAGFPDYMVSNLGRIKRIVGHGCRLERIIKPFDNGRGYFFVSLFKDKKRHPKIVHRLVAIHFVDNLNHKDQVNHINGDKTDNCCSNLEWCTMEENIQHAIENKLMGVKLTKDDVKFIRLAHSTGEFSNKQLAKRFNVTYTCIYKVVNKLSWKQVA